MATASINQHIGMLLAEQGYITNANTLSALKGLQGTSWVGIDSSANELEHLAAVLGEDYNIQRNADGVREGIFHQSDAGIMDDGRLRH